MAGATAKTCIFCGQDCADRPRTKDAQGRYACRACAEERAVKKPEEHAGQVHPSATHTTPGPAHSPLELVIPLAEGSHDDIYQLADGSEPVRAPDPKPCPNCGQIMLGGAVLCTSCGYDDRTGLRAQTSAVAGPVTYQGPRCSNCGYELAGLRSSKCPECGTRNRPGSRREAAEREAKEFVRQEYIRPAIYLAVGLASHAILLAATASTTSIIALPLVLAIQTVGGVIAFYILSALVWGFDAPIGLISIRLAGIFALNNIVQALLARTGVEAIAWGGGALVTYGLIMKEFDIDDWREVWWMMVTMKVVGVIGIVLVASIM